MLRRKSPLNKSGQGKGEAESTEVSDVNGGDLERSMRKDVEERIARRERNPKTDADKKNDETTHGMR
ncbi:hypothetical protein [uncultured Adlercreutzia sp.]|uniref:hypothetical protein n=1 Tax=uncultured Adlercreutzia sp. TaxID=875803 RepID=UPI0026F3A9BC|nr:hypothetical protein [uncultured Adlercreutzia sp.]